jgi:glycosyltransferase 2 family protein
MSKSRRRWWWVAASLVVLVLAVFFISHSAQWKVFRWSVVWVTLTHANPEYLALAIVATYMTYVARAYRWKFFLDPLKKASAWNLFIAQILGFSTIYLVGRTGEIVRPAYIARTEKVPFSSQVAIWLLERIYDATALVLLFALALKTGPAHAATGHAALSLHRMHEVADVILVFCCLMVGGLVLFRLYSDYALERLPGLLSWMPVRVREPLRKVIHSFSTGLEVIQNLRDFLASAGWTVALWFLNVSVFCLVIRSVGGSLAHFPWAAATVTLCLAGIGLIVQLPGVGGGYQAAVILVLQQMFAAPPSQATAAGILAGAIVMLPCMALGAVLLLYEGLTLSKLKSMATDERRAMTAEKAHIHS